MMSLKNLKALGSYDTLPIAAEGAALKTKISPNFSFSRNSTATVVDHEGGLRTAKTNEVRFAGARRVENLVTKTESLTDSVWIKSGLGVGSLPVITQDDATSPRGDDSADRVDLDLNGGATFGDWSWLYYNNYVSDGEVRVFSFWIKAANPSDIGKIIKIAHISAENITLPEEWTRYSFVGTAGSAANYSFGPRLRGGEGTADSCSFYMWGAQIEDASGQANQNPSEYVSNGVAYPFTSNLATSPNDITQPEWLTLNATVNSASNISFLGSTLSYLRQNIISGSTLYPRRTFKIKATMWLDSGSGSVRLAINQNGVTDYISSDIALSTTPTEYELTATVAVAGGTNTSGRIYSDTGNNAVTFNISGISVEECDYHGSGVDGVKYFDYENGNTVASNVVTEARGVGISGIKGYQVEPQATNLLIYSNLSNSAYQNFIGATHTPNDAGGVFGSTTASKMTGDGVSSEHRLVSQNFNIPTTNPFVYSIYAKAGTHNKIQIRTNVVAQGYVNFDLSLGTLSASTAVGGIESLRDGWYRCWAVFPTDASGVNVSVNMITSLASPRAESNTASGDLYIEAPQCEVKNNLNVPSSYTETLGATTTRLADQLSIFPSPSTTDISIKLDYEMVDDPSRYANAIIRMIGTDDSAGSNNEIRNVLGAWDFVPNTGGGYFQTSLVDLTQAGRIGFVLKQNGANADILTALNGETKLNASKSITLDHSDVSLGIGFWQGDVFWGYIKGVKIYDKAISESQLKRLT